MATRFISMTGRAPSAAMSVPAMAGPKMRLRFIEAVCKAVALCSSRRGTSSAIND